jgi:hypothetical protein
MATGRELPVFGGTWGSRYRLDQPWVVSNSAERNDNVDLVIDFLRFISAPDAMQVWQQDQFPPGYPLDKTPAEVYPTLFAGRQYEEGLKEVMHGYYEGQIVGNGARLNKFVGTDPLTQIITAYVADEFTLDEAAEQLQQLEMQQMEEFLRQYPDWDVDNWS